MAKQAKDVMEYNPTEIEPKWQKIWEEKGIYKPDLDKAKKPFYNLMMFPYPSAEGLHVGNVYAFTGADVYGRFKRMQGNDVFEPIGLDGFGIHSENYALKVGKHPKEQAEISEKNFYRQLRSIGNGFDWSKKVETYDADYYRWTQWIFIQLFKRGLAYRKKAPVNFCPKDLTVLADEQVIDGKCERCSSLVEKRDLEQWFFKITDYADRLLHNIPQLNWTKKVKIAQEEWIGKSEGTQISFSVIPNSFRDLNQEKMLKQVQHDKIEVFTTRADTLYGATFLVLAPEHPIVASILDSKFKIQNSKIEEIKKYIKQVKTNTEQERKAEDKEKTGVFSGLYAINPLNQKKIPVWIADYALMGYGTGALFGDAHDERDVAFAKKYRIPLKATVSTGDKEKDKKILSLEEVFIGYGTLVDSGEFTGLPSKEAIKKVTEWLINHGVGKAVTTYHLRDWLISRQRYWGAPIPMIYCQKCEWKPVPEDQLPVLLPDVADWKPKGEGTSPLANIKEFVETTCPNCKGAAKRETDVSDTFLDSAWYFLRYLATDCDSMPFPYSNDQNTKQVRISDFDIRAFAQRARWLPVTMYIGGAEHSVLHLLYSRFITMVFKDMGLISFEEPYARFYAHGLIIKDGAKMSKSKGNVVNPDAYVKKYGADTLRAYLRFVGPFDMGGSFRDSGIEGMYRFLKRVWTLLTPTLSLMEMSSEGLRMMHKTIKGITEDLEGLLFNTVIAKLMSYYNFLSSQQSVSLEEAKTFVLLLAPFTPFLAEELWQKLSSQSVDHLAGKQKTDNWSVHTQQWPTYDEKLLEEDEVIIIVQVNGKTRGTIKVQSAKCKVQSEIEKIARESEKAKRYLKGKTIEKIIFVPGKIINFVISL